MLLQNRSMPPVNMKDYEPLIYRIEGRIKEDPKTIACAGAA